MRPDLLSYRIYIICRCVSCVWLRLAEVIHISIMDRWAGGVGGGWGGGPMLRCCNTTWNTSVEQEHYLHVQCRVSMGTTIASVQSRFVIWPKLKRVFFSFYLSASNTYLPIPGCCPLVECEFCVCAHIGLHAIEYIFAMRAHIFGVFFCKISSPALHTMQICTFECACCGVLVPYDDVAAASAATNHQPPTTSPHKVVVIITNYQ